MRCLRKAWRWWREWRPLVLWPLALYLSVSGVMWAVVRDDYGRGAFLLILGHILDLDATAIAKEQLAKDATP